jgi:hypothetical protein
VIKSVLQEVDCLIGVATARFDAEDRDFREKSLVFATPYLLQESAMAFQSDLPFLILKTREVALQGVTKRNLYLEISDKVHNGKVGFIGSKDLVETSLRRLRECALERRRGRTHAAFMSGLAKVSAVIGAGYVGKQAWDWLTRPDCFGDYYYADRACRTCKFKQDCKGAKARRA